MIRCLLLFVYAAVIDARHFNGGTIRWVPADPYGNTSSSITISIIQSYWWSYPVVSCATNVPVSTSVWVRANTSLACVADCSSDGGYSAKPVSILTDCISASSSLSIMTSQRSVNISLYPTAHFYLAYVGSAWGALNYPTISGLDWSIVTFIDLRMRPDGFINTPPTVSVASPQFVIVNRTIQIQIAVSDVNAGDDVRCRWSTYTAGYRRRKRSDEEEHANDRYIAPLHEKLTDSGEVIHIRKKRACTTSICGVAACDEECSCSCTYCDPAICTTPKCREINGCAFKSTTTTTGTTTTTTPETPGTVKSTSSYLLRQAIDECGGICYPSSVPNGTTLSNCTLTFTGPKSGVWYAVAIQVEDFINNTDTTPMSSVPVQFLIYVMPQPACSTPPIIMPLSDCLEVTVGVPKTFNLYVFNSCNANITNVTNILVSVGVASMQVGNVTRLPTNASLSYVPFTWIPQTNQIGPQQLCMIAYTKEQVQSEEYCVTFTVITSSEVCKTTTSTSTTSSTATSTSSATTTTTKTSTTVTTSTATTTTTKTTTTISTTTSTASTTTTTISTSTSSASTTTTMTTTSTTTTITAVVIAAATTTTSPGKGSSWGLIAGILSAVLPLTLCCLCCLYRLLWSPAAKRRRQLEEEEEQNRWEYNYLTSSTESMQQTTASNTTENTPIEVPRKSYQVYDIPPQKSTLNSTGPTPESGGSILVTIYNNTNARRANGATIDQADKSMEMGNAWMHPSNGGIIDSDVSMTRCVTVADPSADQIMNITASHERFHINRSLNSEENGRIFTSSSLNNGLRGVTSLPPKSASDLERSYRFGSRLHHLKDWPRLYLFGREHDTGAPRISRPS